MSLHIHWPSDFCGVGSCAEDRWSGSILLSQASPSLPLVLQGAAGAGDLPKCEASPRLVLDVTVQRVSGGLVKSTLSGNTSRKFDAVCRDQELNFFYFFNFF